MEMDQDPIFQNSKGTKTSVTTSTLIINVPDECKYMRINTDVDIVISTSSNQSAAVDDGSCARLVANVTEVIPVRAGNKIYALSLGAAATVRCTPLRPRNLS